MKQVVVENPVLNSLFEEPKRHFRFSEDGITDEIVEERRVSTYLVPIAPQVISTAEKTYVYIRDDFWYNG